MSIAIDQTVKSLTDKKHNYDKMMHQKLRQGLEFEKDFSPKGAEDTYVSKNVEIGEVMQAYQWKFTPKLNTDLSAVENPLQRIKIDILFTGEDLEEFWNTYYVDWAQAAGLDPNEWTFPRYLYEEVIRKKIEEEMNQNSWSGVYQDPVDGVAGLSVNSVDGYNIKLQNAITAGDVTPIATGALVQATIINQIETWLDQFPAPYKDAPGYIDCSYEIKEMFERAYRDAYGFAAGREDQNKELRIYATQKYLRPRHCMTGSQRLIFNPSATDNMIWVTKVSSSKRFPLYPEIRWEKFERSLKGMAEIYRSYGWQYWDHLFVNDQL